MRTRRETTLTIDLAMRTWGPRVNEAALAFEARWSRRALRNHNAKWADAFEAALDDFDRAMSTGTASDVNESGARLCRAYAAMAAELGAAKVPDDAYMIGRCPTTKTAIVITASPAAAERARANGLRFAKCFTPDEIATLIGLDERARKIAAVKAAFPGAEISNVSMGVDDDADTDQA